jgi:uncharacterized protein (AIM24 family)
MLVKGTYRRKSIHDRLYQSRQCKRKGVFAAPYPGKILPIDLTEFQGKFICQKFFLCAAKGYLLELNSKKLGRGFFGGEGFIMQKIEGDGLVCTLWRNPRKN